jgi:hypothetical protein
MALERRAPNNEEGSARDTWSFEMGKDGKIGNKKMVQGRMAFKEYKKV